jgi:hypothetical protein
MLFLKLIAIPEKHVPCLCVGEADFDSGCWVVLFPTPFVCDYYEKYVIEAIYLLIPDIPCAK